MKSSIRKINTWSIALIAISIFLASCGYQEYAAADYPDQLIYMPAATHGLYVIDQVAGPIGDVPTKGYASRYKIDKNARKFIVPLGVYRSGINCNGSFIVDISVNTDTLASYISSDPNLTLLPSDKYTIPSSVVIQDGADIAAFELSVDLDFLLNNSPNGKFIIGVEVSSTTRKTNPKFSTTIIVINTLFLKSLTDIN